MCFWAACLVGLFSLFRKSNLFVPSVDQFDPRKHICRTDVEFGPSGAVLSVRWSKTIQFQQCILHIPLPRIMHSPFCPTGALLLCLSRIQKSSSPSPLFCYPTSRGPRPITHIVFQTYLSWLVGCSGFNGPLRQYFSLCRTVSQRERERKEVIDERKNVQTTPTRTYCKRNRPLPYYNPNL